MMTHYAYWEQNTTGKYGLVVYHGSKPGKSVSGDEPKRIGPYEVPDDMIDIDGSVSFGKIAIAFPKPEELS